jgi:outer membrane protein assembly factor BamB
MRTVVFSIPSLQFRVLRTETGELEWEGDYQGMKVIATLPIDNDQKCLILLDLVPGRSGRFQNLVCVGGDGKAVWTAQHVQSHDPFVSIQSNDGLYANTYQGYRVRLDPQTGSILETEFVK